MTNQKSEPLISVVLPIYNGEEYLRESIDSILNQSYSNFEFLILNDGSKDKSEEIIQSYADPRIKYHKHTNCGLAATLNKGIELSKGEFIARQDQDDISLPERFKKQIDFMLSNPKVALVGTNAEIIKNAGEVTDRFLNHISDSKRLKFTLIFNNPFVHSSVMFKKAVITQAGNYNVSKDYFEDYNLWSRVARIADIANVNEYLVKYREVSTSISRTTDDYKVRVRNQCVLNIKYYCPDLTEMKINQFADYIFGLADYTNYSEALGLVEEVLEHISNSFASKEKLSKELFKEDVLSQLVNFKRHYYNKILFSSSSSMLEKMGAKLNRRILFMRYKKLLN